MTGVQLFVAGSYRPPVFSSPFGPRPPQTIISSPDQTALCQRLPSGAPVRLVSVQVSAAGSYRPPVLSVSSSQELPPQMISSLPVQTSLWYTRPSGALVKVIIVQLSLPGL